MVPGSKLSITLARVEGELERSYAAVEALLYKEVKRTVSSLAKRLRNHRVRFVSGMGDWFLVVEGHNGRSFQLNASEDLRDQRLVRLFVPYFELNELLMQANEQRRAWPADYAPPFLGPDLRKVTKR